MLSPVNVFTFRRFVLVGVFPSDLVSIRRFSFLLRLSQHLFSTTFVPVGIFSIRYFDPFGVFLRFIPSAFFTSLVNQCNYEKVNITLK
jgi:hypothetical protein